MLLQRFSSLLTRLSILLISYQLCRIVFLLLNSELLTGQSFSTFVIVLFAGLRFDIFSILVINVPFIICHILSFGLFYKKHYQIILKALFYITNVPALLFNLVDCVYFRFSHKRTTADFFTGEMATDLKFNLPTYVKDFWYLLVILVVLIIITEWLYRKTKVDEAARKPFRILQFTLAFIITIGLTVLGIRGGIQYRPISMQTAARYVTQNLIPAVLNTPFSIIKTRGMEALPEAKFMSHSEADKLFPVVHYYGDQPELTKNVVILIMESFSKEYCGFFNNGNGYTPFLDSICNKGLVYTNAFANSKRSIEGIPAIVASIPHLMDESFISSAFNTNRINGIAGLLKNSGYSGYFFHGGNNGTMGFENFSALAGYDKYYGRQQYDGPSADYDGNWGIFDQPFFLFMKRKLDASPTPFCATFFSLSSHHPYTLPPNYKRRLSKESNPLFESILYADQSLETFFEAASTSSWFKNTLFVITADHTGPAFKPSAMTGKGVFEIPLIFYCPSDSQLKGVNPSIVQHTDILPSVMDYLNYKGSFSAFGQSVFEKGSKSAINYLNGIYQGIDDKYLVLIDGENGSLLGYYNYKSDSLLQHRENKFNKEINQVANKTRAALQQFRTHLMSNDLVQP